MKFLRKHVKPLVMSGSLVLMSATSAFADATTPTSMLTDDVKGVVKDFTADIVPTVMDLIALVVPTGLVLWGIGFAVKKGINFIQKKANRSIG